MPQPTEAPKVFNTRQFMAGNSPAVRIPVSMAFPHQTELRITREGDRIIVEPQAPSLAGALEAFAALAPYFKDFERDQPDLPERDW